MSFPIQLSISFAFRFTPFSAIWTGAVIVLALPMTEFAGVLGPSIEASRRYDGPLREKATAHSSRAPWVSGLELAGRGRSGLRGSCRSSRYCLS